MNLFMFFPLKILNLTDDYHPRSSLVARKGVSRDIRGFLFGSTNNKKIKMANRIKEKGVKLGCFL